MHDPNTEVLWICYVIRYLQITFIFNVRQEREGHCDEQVSLQQVRGCGSHLRQDPAGGTW